MTGFWADRRVFVTGATGMVGSWLVKDLLARGARVAALVLDADPQSELYRSGDVRHVSVVNGNLEEFRTVERAINAFEADTVFHLGAQAIVGVGHRAPLPTLETNVRGTWNVLEACRLHRNLVERVVVASSDKAYGTQRRLPYTEDMPVAGMHPYEVSKSAADLVARMYYHTYGVPVAIARCGNIFGGGDLNWSRIVPGTIRACLRGERPVVRSDGSYVRDYFYVKDAARAYLLLAERLHDARVVGEAFNFSNESPLGVLELVGVIQKLLEAGHLEPDVRNVVEGEIHSQYLSAARAREALGWTPEFDLEGGLVETIAWYRGFLAGRPA
jgi:CDP-glucose 4,6-dehydratase